MDLSKFKTHDWLIVGGGAVFLIAGFLPWWSAGPFSFSGFDYFFTGIVPWLIFVAMGVLTFLAAAEIFKLPETFPAPTVFMVAGAAGTLLVIVRLFGAGHGATSNSGLDRGAGLFLALIAAVIALVGTYMNFTASGGNLAELGQSLQQKANSAQNKGGQSSSQSKGDSAPPPPPGDEQPPPPPSS